MRVEHDNEALADTGDFIGHTFIVDANGAALAEWVDLEDESHVEWMVNAINR